MEKYNRLTVLEKIKKTSEVSGRTKTIAKALCDCGNISYPALSDLRNGRTKSCGCYIKEKIKQDSFRHGMISHPLYRLLSGIKSRCRETNARNRKFYFEKGVTVCDEWKDDFVSFYNWALNNGWKKGLQIDRKDNSLGYTPDNCRFITPRENSNNKDNTLYLTLEGVTKPISIWAEERGIELETLRRRVKKYKWSHERALTEPTRIYDTRRIYGQA